MASTLLADDFNKRIKKNEEIYNNKLASLSGDSFQSAVDDMDEKAGVKITNTVSPQGKSPEQYQKDVNRMDQRAKQLRDRQSKKDNAKMMKEGNPRQTYEKGGLPDLTGDGKITQADVLKGRGVFNEGSLSKKEDTKKKNLFGIKQGKSLLSAILKPTAKKVKEMAKNIKDDVLPIVKELPKDIVGVAKRGGKNLLDSAPVVAEGIKEDVSNIKSGLSDVVGVLKEDVSKVGKGARKLLPFNEGGSLMMPEEGMPVDTYDNIPPEEMDEAMASQLPDDEMEDDYTSYVMDESLDDDEQEYLAGVLESDPRLSDILDKVITVASEFSGAGEVDGPGTGVSDSIPARLSDGEFVMTKKATDQIGSENLQVMMDDAERAYDGGYQMKADGGMMDEDPQDPMTSKTDEEIKKLMMGANKMPSLR